MLKQAIPLLHVSNSEAAETFYTSLGFTLFSAYRPDPAREDPCYLSFRRDGIALHASSFSGDGVAGNVANFIVDDVDALYDGFVANGVSVALPPIDQAWGNREMYVKDADRNTLRFMQPKP